MSNASNPTDVSLTSLHGRVPASFRDPSGYVFQDHEAIFRVINTCYYPQWELLNASGLANQAIKQGLLLPFTLAPGKIEKALVIQADKIPFISYPYEWCFGQLKAAAQHTLQLQLLALENNMVLKDASVYNMQFIGSKSVFIDHLSFDQYVEGAPWAAYLQFCKHFYAPLLLTKYHGFSILKMLALWMDGIALDFAASLLPGKTLLSPSAALHIRAHAKMQAKHADARQSAQKVKQLKISKSSVINLAKSLQNTIANINLPRIKTEWGDYYQDTNYSDAGAIDKQNILDQIAAAHSGALAVDLGANTGVFSKILARHNQYVIASDIDALAVEKHYQTLSKEQASNILPLVLDLANPSPALGWANNERGSFSQRCSAGIISALALIHHLVMTAGIPMPLISSYFADLLAPGGILVLEFVPKEDSQVKRLLAARPDIFHDYNKEHCLRAFAANFTHLHEYAVKDSLRTIHVFAKR